jgi:hypothetical protein
VNGGAKAVGSEDSEEQNTGVYLRTVYLPKLYTDYRDHCRYSRDSDSLEYQELKSSVSRKHSVTSFAVQEAVEIIIPERFYDAYDSHHRENGRKLLRKAGRLNG